MPTIERRKKNRMADRNNFTISLQGGEHPSSMDSPPFFSDQNNASWNCQIYQSWRFFKKNNNLNWKCYVVVYVQNLIYISMYVNGFFSVLWNLKFNFK